MHNTAYRASGGGDLHTEINTTVIITNHINCLQTLTVPIVCYRKPLSKRRVE